MIAGQFSQAMEAAGILPPDTIHADGQLHRFSTTGKRSDSAGWYVLHADGLPAGVFGCWRSGLTQVWCSKADSAMSQAERDTMRQRVRDAKAQRDAATLQRQQQAHSEACARWETALPVMQHPYLTAKGIQPFGLRAEGAALLVPMRDTSGILHSLQTIAPDGRKRFMSGGRVHGCYHAVGRPGMALVLGEGMATMHSIRAATGLAVAAAFSAGNLAPSPRPCAASSRLCPSSWRLTMTTPPRATLAWQQRAPPRWLWAAWWLLRSSLLTARARRPTSTTCFPWLALARCARALPRFWRACPMKTADHSTAAVALACNRARLVRIALTRRTPCWPHPLHFQAEPALKQARKPDAQALAALRKACARTHPAPMTIDAGPLPGKAGALVLDVRATEVTTC